ncbi:MAG: NAD(P)/FAD-dependent oxidoreductase [Candidatus Aenigmatarchaeota archaeon]
MKVLNADVLVVGSGASGSSTSFLLSKMGFNVITVDRISKIGGFTNSKIDITESELPDGSKLEPVLKELQIKPLKRCNISVWHSRNERFTLKSHVYDFYFKRGESTDSIDYQVMKKAINRGCNVLFDTHVLKFQFKNGNVETVLLKHKNRKILIKPRIVVGADGSFSICRKLAGIKELKSSVLEGFGAMFGRIDLKETHAIFDREFAPGGYVFMGNAKQEGVIGVIIDNQLTKKPAKHFFDINMKQNPLLKIFQSIKPLNFFGGNGKYGIVERLVQGNVILVGGAGLLVDPFIGYGLNYAIFSAHKAAHIITKSLVERNVLTDYDKMYKEQFVPYFRNTIKTREIFKKLNNRDIDFVIRSLRFVDEKKAEGLKALIEIIKAKPTSINAVSLLHAFQSNPL